MLEINFFTALVENIQNTGILEIIAVLFGIASVWFAKKANILVYPTGIISVLIYVYLCYYAGLYADMGINGVYFIMSVYGWILWSRKTETKPKRPITFCNLKLHILIIFVLIFFFFNLTYLLKHHTDSTVPVWDALTTSIFIAAMLLMALKKVENWLLWIVGDIISIPLYFSKEMVFTSIQYLVFLILAVLGYMEWVKIYKREHKLDKKSSNNRS